ncbi:MAG TPA: DUF2332 family protein [Polyangia bacterium]|nr:DUF2332 family protein [Polyangia bacterium]
MSPLCRGLEAFAEDATAWRHAVGARVPVYDRLLEAAVNLIGHPEGPVEATAGARLEAAWRERRSSTAYDRPLLLMAALRAEALRAGARHPLFAAIGAVVVDPGAARREALAAALADAPARLFVDLATRSVQTNETSRAVAWLWPAALAGVTDRRPVALFDIGCSGGLNLTAETLPAVWTDAAGAALSVASSARIVSREGFDAHPLDVGRDDDVMWLRACVWPGETDRLARLDRAVGAFLEAASSANPPRLHIADVADIPGRLGRRAAELPADTLLLAYQTVMRDYLPEARQKRYLADMAAWVAGEVAGGPRRIWIELETDPPADPRAPPMALTAHVFEAADGAGRARAIALARCGYHPDRLAPDAPGVASFVEDLARHQNL